jgi:ubiquinone/menaquinone biosynthesis C-methylase UbiE
MTGIDPHEGRIERARAAAAEAGVKIAFEVAAGENLPYADGAFDVALLSNSLHHVAEDRMAATINEAARMVRPGGLLYAMEPVPRGPYFEVQSLWNDETANRARAYDEIGAAAKLGFENEAERFYIEARSVDDFDTYVARAGARHQSRRAEIERQSDRIRQKFEQHAVRADGGFALDMVFRVNLMRKSA